MDVVGGRLGPHEDHVFAGGGELTCSVCVEHRATAGGAGRRRESHCDDVDNRVRVDRRMQKLLDRFRVDASHRLPPVDRSLVDECDRRGHRGEAGALRRACLQDEQAVALDRELDILHVAVVRLERLDDLLELGEGTRQLVAHALDRLGGTRPGNDVLALRVDQKLAVDARLARRGVAAEADPGRRARVAIPEHHLHHVHAGAEVVGDVVLVPIDLSARSVPGREDRADRCSELRVRVAGELFPGVLAVDRLEPVGERLEVGRRELGVELDTPVGFQRLDRRLEHGPVDALDDVAVHLDQPPVRVVCEPPVAGETAEPVGDATREAEVQDRLHHPGHRDRPA